MLPRRFPLLDLRIAAAVALFAHPATAQHARETEVALTIGPTFIDFRGLGGFGAAALQLRVSRYFGASSGGDVAAFTIVSAGGATSVAGCVPGGSCPSRSTPGAVTGVAGSFFRVIGETGIRASVGVGWVRAFGGEGPGARASLAGSVGLDWVSRRISRVRPTLGVRVMQTAKPLLGARTLFLPGVGVTF